MRAYATNSNGTGYGNQVQFTTVWDGTCSAFTSPGVRKEFMCQNLGADVTADPFTPSWKLNGDYYQWGRNVVAAAGPTGPDDSQSNSGLIVGWNNTSSDNGSWSDASKTANDPCPKNYRVPTSSEWSGVLNNNTSQLIGTWSFLVSNYSSSLKLENTFYLPTAGMRVYNSGMLDKRGIYGCYWTSTEILNTYAYPLVFNYNITYSYLETSFNRTVRTTGMSVRCIAE